MTSGVFLPFPESIFTVGALVVNCILLGTGGMMPMPHRLLTSLVVRLNGNIYLFDAGEATQLGWKKVRLGLRGFNLLAVTHLHADHCLGIPGLMMLRAQMENPEAFTILGPPGIEKFITEIQKLLEFYTNYDVHFIEWPGPDQELAYHDAHVRIYWQPLQHTRFCLGYRLEEKERPGKFNAHRASQLGVPKGPLWGSLQRGQSVTLEDAREISPSQVLGPLRKGRHIAFVVDTRTTKSIYRLCRDVDIAFIEGMFLPEHEEHAENKGHLTVTEAARIAGRAGAARAVLIHISPRYDNDQLDQLEVAAKSRFANAQIGRDLESFTIPLFD
jgi:ribonuclease Z